MEFQTSWPFLYLLMSIYLGAPLLLGQYQTQKGISTTNTFNSWLKRTNDVRWYLLLAVPLYMLHQFEEYGIDLYGRHFEFHRVMCSHMKADPDDCLIRPWQLTFINAVLITFASYRARLPGAATGAGANFYGVAFVNGLFHLANSIRDGAAGEEAYNPGLITALLTLTPCAFGVLRAMRNQGLLTTMGVVRALAVGVLAHAILLPSLFARSRDVIGDVPFVLILVVDILGLLSLDRP